MVSLTETPGMSTLEVKSPITGEVVGKAPIASPEEVNATVERARVAAESWGAMPIAERRRELVAFRRRVAARADEFADTIHRENGKPRLDATVEVMMALSHIHHAAVRAEKVLRPRRVSAGLLANFRAEVSYFPLGVVAVIGPWNYPLFTPMGSIAYALAAGNAVVFKPSELTPLTAILLAEVARESFSVPELLQVVTGEGETGAALAGSAVDKIAFTGSAPTGRKVMAKAAERLTPVLMELGGKDAAVVADDADIDKAAAATVYGALANTGQACVSIERVYVAQAIYDRFVAKVVEQAGRVTVGDGAADLGPMTSEAQVDIVRDHLNDAVAKGAEVIVGGVDEIRGRYIKPTVLVGATPEMKIMTEETFGPVVAIARAKDAADGVRQANRSAYGLGSAIFGRARVRELAAQIRAGMTSVNSVLAFSGIPSLPFGGMGESGFGRIHGDEGLREFSRTKSTAEERVPLPMSLLSFGLPANTADRIKAMIHQLYGGGALDRAGSALRSLRR